MPCRTVFWVGSATNGNALCIVSETSCQCRKWDSCCRLLQFLPWRNSYSDLDFWSTAHFSVWEAETTFQCLAGFYTQCPILRRLMFEAVRGGLQDTGRREKCQFQTLRRERFSLKWAEVKTHSACDRFVENFLIVRDTQQLQKRLATDDIRQ